MLKDSSSEHAPYDLMLSLIYAFHHSSINSSLIDHLFTSLAHKHPSPVPTPTLLPPFLQSFFKSC